MRIVKKDFAKILDAISKTNVLGNKADNAEDKNSVRLIAANGNLTMISTSNEINIAYKCDSAELSGPMDITLDNSKLASKINAISSTDGTVSIEQENESVVATSDKTIVQLDNCTPKQKKFPSIKEEAAVSVFVEDLIKSIKSTRLAVSSSNEVMSHIKMAFKKASYEFGFIGFNGTMLAVAKVPLEDVNDNMDDFSYLINGKSLGAICDALELVSDEIADIIISGDRTMLVISAANLKVTIPLKPMEFINIDKLLSEEFPNYVVFNKKEIKKELAAAKKLAGTTLNFKSDGDEKVLSSNGFLKYINVVNASDVYFNLPIDVWMTLINVIEDLEVKFSVSNRGLIKISPVSNDNILFITTGCK